LDGFPEKAPFSVAEMSENRGKLLDAVCGVFGPDPLMLNRAGVLAARKGEPALAVAAFAAALAFDPEFTEAARNLARATARLSGA
jgi:hypothetical protein